MRGGEGTFADMISAMDLVLGQGFNSTASRPCCSWSSASTSGRRCSYGCPRNSSTRLPWSRCGGCDRGSSTSCTDFRSTTSTGSPGASSVPVAGHELAEAELARRGVTGAPRSAADAAQEPALSKPLGLVWADLYGGLLGMSAVGNPVASVLNHAPWSTIALQIIVGCCTAPVAYGPRKRRYWAWLLNWLFITWISVTFVVRSPGVGGLVVAAGWMILHGRYFGRRKSFFARDKIQPGRGLIV